MADLPLLFFPLRGTAPRKKKRGGGDRVFPKSIAIQEAKLSDQITHLEQDFERRRLALQADPNNTSPETVLVLELATSVTNFAKAAAKVGLAVLGEWDGDELAADTLGFAVYRKKDKLKREQVSTAHVYLTAANLGAGAEFRRLFEIWRGAASWPPGTTPWRDVFDCILRIRPWGPEDRLRDSGLAQDWQESIEAGLQTVQFEADFWFRPQTATSRDQVTEKFRRQLEQLGGAVKHQTVIEAIGFHGVLGELPVAAISDIQNIAQLEFIRFEEVFEVHRVTQGVEPRTLDGVDAPAPVSPTGTASGTPVVACIDGVPMQNHPDVAGYITVNDADNLESLAPANERVHASQIASLVVNGDLTHSLSKLRRPVVVRPVLVPETNFKGLIERFPVDRLAIDTFHRAVLDLVVREEQRSSRERIHVINVSLGDPNRMFLRRMSPWARLIDWLAFKHRVLFIVSAGNCLKSVTLPVNEMELSSSSPDQIQALVLDAIYLDRRNRRLLAPAESINAITVGAARGEGSTTFTAQQLESVVLEGLSTTYSAMGSGYRNTLKPDILAPGGRQLFRKSLRAAGDATVRLEAVDGKGPPGLLVATPSSPVQGPRRCHTRGTSAAAALATRLAAQVFETLEGLPGAADMSGNHIAVVIKALVAHTANWSEEAEGQLIALLSKNGVTSTKVKDAISRFLGHGCIRPARALACTESRVTAIGFADISDGEGHLYELPWPAVLRAVTEERRLTITVASLVPTTPNRYVYRGADVWAGKPGELTSLGLGSGDRDPHSVQRGTLQHTCYSGTRASDFSDGTKVTLQVNCRADSMEPDEVKHIPYALAVTLEIPEASGIQIYEQVALSLRAQTRVAIR
jgi:hypothetical protein